MPVYEFECLDCRQRFEEVLSLKEYEARIKQGFSCPKCKSQRVEQLLLVEVTTSKKS